MCGRGLDQDNDLIGHTNVITAGNFAGINYDGNGPCNYSSEWLSRLVLCQQRRAEIGAIKPGTGLEVQGDGTLDHSNSIAAGDIGGLQYDAEGHITAIPANAVFERDDPYRWQSGD